LTLDGPLSRNVASTNLPVRLINELNLAGATVLRMDGFDFFGKEAARALIAAVIA